MALARRKLFHAILEAALGSEHVYFQQPEGRVMQYPCIVYERERISAKYADNVMYDHQVGYDVTLIDRNPDSDVVDRLLALPLCSFSRHFATSGLNHDVFTIYH